MHCAVTRKETSSTTKGEQEKIFGVRKIDLVTPSYRNASGTIGYRWEKTNVFFYFCNTSGMIADHPIMYFYEYEFLSGKA